MGELTLVEFNALSDTDAQTQAEHFCGCVSWARDVVAARPFNSVAQLSRFAADRWQQASEAERLEAFAAHPLIGDVELLRQKYADTARGEQGQVLTASEATLEALASLNRAYQELHGFIFIICASGKSADEMLTALQGRIDNTRADEVANASREQAAITALRIQQTFGDQA